MALNLLRELAIRWFIELNRRHERCEDIADMTMTPAEVVAEMKSDSLLNKVRQALTNHHATMEQAGKQRKPPGIIEFRNMEFDAARALIALIREHDADDMPMHCPGCDGDHL